MEVNRGIKINDRMQTNDENIYAGGDSVEIKSFVTNNDVLIPLAGSANRQGRIIADNICGINSIYHCVATSDFHLQQSETRL